MDHLGNVGDPGLFKHLDLEAIRLLLDKISLRIDILAPTSHLGGRKAGDFLYELLEFCLSCSLCGATVSKQVIVEMVGHRHAVAVLLQGWLRLWISEVRCTTWRD